MHEDKYYKVLDDGFIALKTSMGSDETIEQAARVSYGKGTRSVSDTRNLIRYLMRHYHTTPFEMCEVSFHIRAPIYVIRQWHRHRTWSYNEYSGRYSEMIDSTESASTWRSQSASNKQGSSGSVDDYPSGFTSPLALPKNPNHYLSMRESDLNEHSREVYEERLKFGVAREQARKDLPVSNYTEMYAKVDLKNLFGFLRLRCDSHAQLEIRSYANVMAGIVKDLFPIAYEAWEDYQFLSSPLSHLDKQLLSVILGQGLVEIDTNEHILQKYQELGMSKREFGEFLAKIHPSDRPEFDLSNHELYDLGDRE